MLLRRLACLVLVLVGCATAQAQDAVPEPSNFFLDALDSLFRFDMRGLMAILERPQYTVAAFIVINAIVFVETGLLIGFFLPGDSLLVVAGLLCYRCSWNLPLLLATVSASAIIGDSLGYAIGKKTGPKIFHREKSLLFNKNHLLKAQEFYQRHGGKTIILARFVPIIRTFAPVVAGVGCMDYGKFLLFNIVGGIGWVFSMVLLGYFLPSVLNPFFQSFLGPDFEVQHHIEKVVVLVVLASIAPAIFAWIRERRKAKTTETAEPVKVG